MRFEPLHSILEGMVSHRMEKAAAVTLRTVLVLFSSLHIIMIQSAAAQTRLSLDQIEDEGLTVQREQNSKATHISASQIRGTPDIGLYGVRTRYKGCQTETIGTTREWTCLTTGQKVIKDPTCMKGPFPMGVVYAGESVKCTVAISQPEGYKAHLVVPNGFTILFDSLEIAPGETTAKFVAWRNVMSRMAETQGKVVTTSGTLWNADGPAENFVGLALPLP